MTGWRRRHRPKNPCLLVDLVWGPHEGCREFMTAPDEMPCLAPATHLAKAADHDGLPVRDRCCDRHAALLRSHPEMYGVRDARVYRFRHLR